MRPEIVAFGGFAAEPRLVIRFQLESRGCAEMAFLRRAKETAG